MPVLEALRSSSESTVSIGRISASSSSSINSPTNDIELVKMESEDGAVSGDDSKVSDNMKNVLPNSLNACGKANLGFSIDAAPCNLNGSINSNGNNREYKSDAGTGNAMNDIGKMDQKCNTPNIVCCENTEKHGESGSFVSDEDNCSDVNCDTSNSNTNKQENENEQDIKLGDSVCSESNGTGEQSTTCVSSDDNCLSELMPNETNADIDTEHLEVASLEENKTNSAKSALQTESIESNKPPERMPDKSSDTVESGSVIYVRNSDTEPDNKTTKYGQEMVIHPDIHAPADPNVNKDTECAGYNTTQNSGGDGTQTVKNCEENIPDEYEEEMNSEFYEGICEVIPKDIWKISLKCLSYGTITDISYRLDITDPVVVHSFAKDFTGLCDKLKLDPAFTKYLVKSHIKLKTEEVLSKWEVLKPGEGPRPTVGNFAKIVYYDLDRPDVIHDLRDKIVQDAENFEKTKNEAKTDTPEDEDRSWEMTRHDVATGKKTYYTCCLCYADEDEGMATLITNFFQAVCKGNTRFFRPQFDLKMGRYYCDTTAKVIEERCNGKVIFLLSDYFYANPICQFAVNFAHSRNPTAEQGNLIPFYLTNKYEIAPKVLKGIAGVRWARKQFRYHSWGQLTDCLMARSDETDQTSNQSELSEMRARIKVELDSSPSEWLCDPPYDKDTPEPGPALPLNEPPEDSVNSSSFFDPDAVDNSQLVNADARNSSKWYRRLLFRVRNAVSNLGSRRNRVPRRSRHIRPEELNRAFEEDRDPPSLV